MHTDYLVYEHWRTDTNMPFYVGKANARNRRAHNLTRRQKHHRSVAEKVLREGGEIVVKIVESGLPEESAFAFEKMKIAYWRAMGAVLVNKSEGGEGPSGFRFSQEQRRMLSERVTPEERQRRSERMKLSGGDILAASVAKRASPDYISPLRGRKRPQEFCEKLSELYTGEGNPMFGRTTSDKQKQAVRAANLGRKRGPMPDEVKAKMIATKAARFKGVSDETRAKLSARTAAYHARKRAEKELCGVAASGN